MSAVPGVHHVESRSRQGISVVQVWFNYDADLNAGQNDIIQRIQQIMNTLPAGRQADFILRFDLSNIPVCLITCPGGGLDETQLYDIAYNTVEPQLERIYGVASANVDGGKIARSPSTSTVTSCTRRASPSPRLPARSTTRTSSCRPATSSSAPSTTTCSRTTSSSRRADGEHHRPPGRARPIRVRDLGHVGDSAEQQTRSSGRRRESGVPSRQQAAVRQYHRGRRRRRAPLPKLDRVPPGVRSDSPSTSRPTSDSRSRASGTRPFRGRLAFLVILIFLGARCRRSSFRSPSPYR